MEEKPKPKKGRRLPVILTVTEVEALLDAARNSVNRARTAGVEYRSWRDFVMVQTGVLAGPRVADLLAGNFRRDLVGLVISIRWGESGLASLMVFLGPLFDLTPQDPDVLILRNPIRGPP